MKSNRFAASMPVCAADLAEAIDRYLQTSFEKETPARVDELAQTLGVSRETLTRWCKRLLGDSPGRLLKRGQMKFATMLLSETSGTTASIAYASAFGTRRTLFRAYRRQYGQSPRQAVGRQQKESD